MCLFSAFFCILVELDSLLVCGAVDFYMEHVEGSRVQTMHLRYARNLLVFLVVHIAFEYDQFSGSFNLRG